MECHKCEHNGKGNEACWTCDGNAPPSNHGHSFVSMDAAKNPDSVLVKGKQLRVEAETSDYGLDAAQAEAVRRFMAPFFSLRECPDDLALIVTLAGGGSGSEYGRRRGVTRQAVNKRLLRLAALHREFRYLVPRVDFSRVDTSRYLLHHRKWRRRDLLQMDFFNVLFAKQTQTRTT